MNSLSVIVVSWNVCDLLARCFQSLISDPDLPAETRILVVDNASRDGSVEMIPARFPQVEVIALQENTGFAGGNNVGLRALGLFGPHPGSTTPPPFHGGGAGGGGESENFVLLLNPDTEVQPGAIAALLDAIRTRPDAAVVTSSLCYGDGEFQHSAFRFPGLAQLYIDLFPVHPRLYESRLNGRYPRRLYQLGRPFEIDHPLGAVMLLRAEAIRRTGLFDEGFALYCEEVDWCARFKEAGWRNYCAPAARIVHHSGRSTSQAKVESFVKLWTARHRLHSQHPRFAPMLLARLIVRAGMRRKMRGTSAEMQAACRRVIEVWK